MRMRNRSWWLGALLATAAACGSTQSRPQAQASGPPPHEHESSGGAMCPMMSSMKDAQIVASDTSDGAAIVFTTAGDVAGLRAHVRKMAEMGTRMASGGMMGMEKQEGMRGEGKGMAGNGMHGGGMGMKGDMHGDGGMMGKHVPARASVEDVPGGARLVLTPVDPAQLAALREQTRSHAAMMSKGECPMMESGPAAPTEQKPETPAADEDHKQHHPAGT
jgi:hypothetical protein